MIETLKSDTIAGLAKASKTEQEKLEFSLERERNWYPDYRAYNTFRGIEKAINRGDLIELYDSTNIRRLPRFGSATGFIPYVTRQTWQAAHDFSDLWREIMWDEHGYVNEEIRLAATSMVRYQKYQNKLVKDRNKLASPDSRHCLGAAIDFDASAYYGITKEGRVLSYADPRRHEGQTKLSRLIIKQYGNDTPTEIASPIRYQQRVMDCAIKAAQIMHNQEKINFIHEFAGTENACIHMAVNPDY